MRLTTPLRCLLALILCSAVLPLSAQFNGPSPLTSGQLNQDNPITNDQALLNPGSRDVHLSQGDLITVTILGQPEYAPPLRIGADGNILLPLIGVVSLKGMSITQAEQFIAAKLDAAGMFNQPQVTIQVTDGPNTSVTLIGELHGVIPVQGTRRLLDVISTGGGLPQTASHVITIHRPGVEAPIVVDLGTDPATSALANVPVFPGDTIVVPRLGLVYVLGSFGRQGTVQLTGDTPLTLLELTSLTGGPTFQGKNNDLRIIRTVGDHRTVVRMNIKKVMAGKEPDPILRANDIVYLPESAIKAAITNGTLSTALSLLSVTLSTLAYVHSK